MKTIQYIALVLAVCLTVSVKAQEKRIAFSKGELRICSAKNFEIQGYNGTEVIIKSLHEKKDTNFTYAVRGYARTESDNTSSPSQKGLATTSPENGSVLYYFGDGERKKGLKKLGKNQENEDLGIYFLIEEKAGELIFKDKVTPEGAFTLYGGERYLVKVPNSVKINWTTGSCAKDFEQTSSKAPKARSVFFYDSNPSSITDFEGEVEISSTLNNFTLKDVVGPVTINTIGGNVTVEFEKKSPKKLYSIYSNNGFIDMQIPENASIAMDVVGKSVYSDVNFAVLSEKEEGEVGHKKTAMNLKLGSGKVKMKLDASYGTIYLRKQ